MFSMMFASAGRRTGPIIDQLPAQANLVAFWDAADINSWSGSGSWKNLEPTPADGAAQTAYDLQLGSTSGSDANDPTFSGTPGGLSSSEYFSLSATTGFELPTNTTFTAGMHRSNAEWTLGWIVDAGAGLGYLASTVTAGSAANRGFFVVGAMQYINAGGGPLQSWSPGTGFHRLTVSLDGDLNPTWTYSIDGTLSTPSLAPAGTDTSSTADRSLMLFNGNGYTTGIVGGKAYAAVIWNKRLTSAEVTTFNNAFAARFGY